MRVISSFEKVMEITKILKSMEILITNTNFSSYVKLKNLLVGRSCYLWVKSHFKNPVIIIDKKSHVNSLVINF